MMLSRTMVLAAGLLGVGLAAPVAAAPFTPAQSVAGQSTLVETVQGYRYHRNCYWTGSGWGYKHGGKVLVCRPYKPRGHGWHWHSEGGRHGWYHRSHKRWHHKW